MVDRGRLVRRGVSGIEAAREVMDRADGRLEKEDRKMMGIVCMNQERNYYLE